MNCMKGQYQMFDQGVQIPHKNQVNNSYNTKMGLNIDEKFRFPKSFYVNKVLSNPVSFSCFQPILW